MPTPPLSGSNSKACSTTKVSPVNDQFNPAAFIAGVIVLVDREQGGARQLRETGYTLLSAFTLSNLLDYYVDANCIEASKREEVHAYLAASA